VDTTYIRAGVNVALIYTAPAATAAASSRELYIPVLIEHGLSECSLGSDQFWDFRPATLKPGVAVKNYFH